MSGSKMAVYLPVKVLNYMFIALLYFRMLFYEEWLMIDFLHGEFFFTNLLCFWYFNELLKLAYSNEIFVRYMLKFTGKKHLNSAAMGTNLSTYNENGLHVWMNLKYQLPCLHRIRNTNNWMEF